jgi:methionyl-tRNA formyltransferase
MRIVFFGASDLGFQCCERLLEIGQDVVAIVTMPREFAISYSPARPVTNVLHRDFHLLGAERGVPVIQAADGMKGISEQVAPLRPDLLVVVGWYYLIPKSLRALAPLGCVGVHASLLPKYRGGAPLVWAMINGEREAGVSLFYLEDGVDDGDIIAQSSFPIEEQDSIREVLAKATAESVVLVGEMIPRLADGSAPRSPQDHSQATRVPQRSPEDGAIDWSWSATRLRDFIRAQTRPYPGAFTIIGGKRVTIWSADVVDA